MEEYLSCWRKEGVHSASYTHCLFFVRFLTHCHNLVFHAILFSFFYLSQIFFHFVTPVASSNRFILIYFESVVLKTDEFEAAFVAVKGKKPLITVIK